MYIELTPQARQQLQLKNGVSPVKIRLLYDNEGCGCAVTGVPKLQLIANPHEQERISIGSSDDVQLYYNPLHAIYFEDRLKIDYSSDRNAFSLKSDGQIYAADIRLEDVR